jgi:hypothetical protein
MRAVLRKIGMAAAMAIVIAGSMAAFPGLADARGGGGAGGGSHGSGGARFGGGGHYGGGGGYYGGGGYGGWGGFAAGAVAGAIVGGIAAAPYYYPDAGYAYEPAPGDAVAYCMQRFRSYDPRSGTYLGNDGYRHPCP